MMRHILKLAQLLLRAEEEAGQGAGALKVFLSDDEEPLGEIMGEDSRICWAYARLYGRRLSDLILEEAEIASDTLMQVILDCQGTKKPFGERLLELGLLTESQLRKTLRSQTVSAAMALARTLVSRGHKEPTYERERTRTYQPRFTFSALEIIETAVELSPECAGEPWEPPEIFTRLAGDADAAFCFVETETPGLPALPISSSKPETLRLVDALATFGAARALIEPPNLTSAGLTPYAATIRTDSYNWLACYWKPHLCLVTVDDRDARFQALGALVEESRARA